MKLRDYQQTQHDIVRSHLSDPTSPQRAQIYSPTGSGKTVNFFKIIDELPTIQESSIKLNICIVYPRIALIQEQMTRFKKEFGTEYHVTSFHSGGHVRGEECVKEESTTDSQRLKECISNTTKHHITFTSYYSLHKLEDIEFDLLLCDEAHNLVPSRSDEHNIFSKIDTLKNLMAKRILFYTATPINDKSTESEGMENSDMFGHIISRTEPKLLMQAGYIVGPIIQMIDVTTDKVGDVLNPTETVILAFENQQKTMAKTGLDVIKMLVTSSGYEDHAHIESDIDIIKTKLGMNVDVYVIESNEARKNGLRMKSRHDALVEIDRTLNSAIVIHYDTISEGIDISSLTGVCLLRRCRQYKILQTIGRAGRPDTRDMDINHEVIDMKTRFKPYCILTLPVVDGNHVGGITTANIAEMFIDGGYGELADLIDRDGKDSPKGLHCVDEDSDMIPEAVESLYSNACDIKVTNNLRKLTEIGLIF